MRPPTDRQEARALYMATWSFRWAMAAAAFVATAIILTPRGAPIPVPAATTSTTGVSP